MKVDSPHHLVESIVRDIGPEEILTSFWETKKKFCLEKRQEKGALIYSLKKMSPLNPQNPKTHYWWTLWWSRGLRWNGPFCPSGKLIGVQGKRKTDKRVGRDHTTFVTINTRCKLILFPIPKSVSGHWTLLRSRPCQINPGGSSCVAFKERLILGKFRNKADHRPSVSLGFCNQSSSFTWS